MAQKKKISMPASYGGLLRYFEDYKSKIALKPMQVVVFTIMIIIIVIILHIIGPGIFGF